MYSRVIRVYRACSIFNGIDTIRIGYYFRGQAIRIVMLVFSVILLASDSLLAEAESTTKVLNVSATVMPSCGIASTTPTFRNSDTEVVGEINQIKIATVLNIGCNPGYNGTIALSVGTNVAGNATIRIISNDQAGAEIAKKVYLTDDGKPLARQTSLGLFPMTGPKEILIHSHSPIGSNATPGADDQKVTLNVDF